MTKHPRWIKWSKALDRLIGQAPDTAIAARINNALSRYPSLDGSVSAEAVRRRRVALGLAPQRSVVQWSIDDDAALLAQPNNAQAAEALGRTVAAVKVRRSRLKAAM